MLQYIFMYTIQANNLRFSEDEIFIALNDFLQLLLLRKLSFADTEV